MLTRWTPQLLSILRIVVGFLFVMHGTQKLFDFPAPMPGGTPQLSSLIGVAGILEVAGGALMILGLLTRPVAFLLSGQMAVAYFRVHAPQSFWPLLNSGELAALYSFTFLYFVAAGAGPWSLDALIGQWRSRSRTEVRRQPATVYPHRRAG